LAEPRDYCEILGVARDADEKAIKNAFRQLALKHHPDRNKEPGATDRFREIAEAYAVLSNPNKRAEYDAGGHAGVADFSAEDLFGGIDFGDIFGMKWPRAAGPFLAAVKWEGRLLVVLYQVAVGSVWGWF